ncbi:MAG: phosphoheptose isomerase [Desulfobacca sp. 4484_104]|nr:MAG: phosphoheptose isomerase [Desulfobacca sp. 4484_104]RLA90696.1 MAG: D-sedoheptulose 7-phosphate isomerase [Deltaproteobacteria bacterium]
MPLESRVKDFFIESARLKAQFIEEQAPLVVQAAQLLAASLRQGAKILIFGNGGSAADAQHLAAEFVNRFRIARPPLAALALTTDSSILTSIGNDYDFNEIFVKQIKALGQPGDVAWGISTSGTSANVVAALEIARQQGLKTIAVTGRDGGTMAAAADVALIVRSQDTPRIQEVHLTIGHVLCELVDYLLFPDQYSAG